MIKVRTVFKKRFSNCLVLINSTRVLYEGILADDVSERSKICIHVPDQDSSVKTDQARLTRCFLKMAKHLGNFIRLIKLI